MMTIDEMNDASHLRGLLMWATATILYERTTRRRMTATRKRGRSTRPLRASRVVEVR
jgi:hypothetical protein